jgi:hypothetical protein
MHAFYGNELLDIHLMQRRVDLLFEQNIPKLLITLVKTNCLYFTQHRNALSSKVSSPLLIQTTVKSELDSGLSRRVGTLPNFA